MRLSEEFHFISENMVIINLIHKYLLFNNNHNLILTYKEYIIR